MLDYRENALLDVKMLDYRENALLDVNFTYSGFYQQMLIKGVKVVLF